MQRTLPTRSSYREIRAFNLHLVVTKVMDCGDLLVGRGKPNQHGEGYVELNPDTLLFHLIWWCNVGAGVDCHDTLLAPLIRLNPSSVGWVTCYPRGFFGWSEMVRYK